MPPSATSLSAHRLSDERDVLGPVGGLGPVDAFRDHNIYIYRERERQRQRETERGVEMVESALGACCGASSSKARQTQLYPTYRLSYQCIRP